MTDLKLKTQIVLNQLNSDMSLDLKNYERQEQEHCQRVLKEVSGDDESLYTRLNDEFFGVGPLTQILNDESVSEILVNSAEEIWVESEGRLKRHHDCFLSESTYSNFFERLFSETNSELTVNTPFLDTCWKGHRVHIVGKPVATCYGMSLRKSRKQTWSLAELSSKGWAESSVIEQLKAIVAKRENTLIVGGTSSGKTSVLNALIQETSPTERLVFIEDTEELSIPNNVSTRLVTRFDAKDILRHITLQDLLKQTLRMRPDRLVVGEVRGQEAKDLLMALSTGHEGSFGTLHANTAQEALLRLEMLIQLGAPQWSLSAIRRLMLLTIQNIIVVKRRPDGGRSFEGLYKIRSLEEFGFLIERVI